MKKLTDEIIANDEFLLDDLINNLRNDLRDQLGLENITGNVKWLRFDDDYKHMTKAQSEIKPPEKLTYKYFADTWKVLE